VISLNTMYFYDSNKGKWCPSMDISATQCFRVDPAVGGCEYDDRDDPGNLQFDWLEVQLQSFRKRGVKVRPPFLHQSIHPGRSAISQVWLAGHVPPSTGNYFPECVCIPCLLIYLTLIGCEAC
jgi:endopolyphosphatase